MVALLLQRNRKRCQDGRCLAHVVDVIEQV